jgi:hypothetical protein
MAATQGAIALNTIPEAVEAFGKDQVIEHHVGM